MNPPDNIPQGQRAKAIFSEAVDLPRDARDPFLRRACGHDAALRHRVDALLRAHDEAEGFLDRPTAAADPISADPIPITPSPFKSQIRRGGGEVRGEGAPSPSPFRGEGRGEGIPNGTPANPLPRDSHLARSADTTIRAAELPEKPGTRIGRYKLLQQIGEGGFGVVFMAEQETPVRRRVAIKVIKLGMDTKQVIARFEAERQALALMDHPNIARVLDAGATDSGRPYFVMEYVIGHPITQFADAHKLSVRARLDLFGQVCSAVQHAHTKGIIHRDFKPRNVLVSMSDGKPLARVIDFGIAKATGARLTEKTLFTEHNQFIGTPEYMSPEQAEGSPDIDTRTDVYSLGVLLYELLTGATPFDSTRLRSAAYAEMQRIIKEEEPPAPSIRLSRGLPALAAAAAMRQTEPAKLGPLIRGELDWIVMKALDKDRARRYESPNQLRADIERHLQGEPVVAAPPSIAYRVKKFVRKHRGQLVAACLIVVTLIGGIATTTWQWRQAEALRKQQTGWLSQALEGLSRMLVAHDPEAETRGVPFDAKTGHAIVPRRLSIRGFDSVSVAPSTSDSPSISIEFDDPGEALSWLVDSAISHASLARERNQSLQQQRDLALAAKKEAMAERDMAEAAQRLAERYETWMQLEELENRQAHSTNEEATAADDDCLLRQRKGCLYFKLARFDDAIELLRDCEPTLSIWITTGGNRQHRAVSFDSPVEVPRCLALSYIMTGRDADAVPWIMRLRRLAETADEPTNPVNSIMPAGTVVNRSEAAKSALAEIKKITESVPTLTALARWARLTGARDTCLERLNRDSQIGPESRRIGAEMIERAVESVFMRRGVTVTMEPINSGTANGLPTPPVSRPMSSSPASVPATGTASQPAAAARASSQPRAAVLPSITQPVTQPGSTRE